MTAFTKPVVWGPINFGTWVSGYNSVDLGNTVIVLDDADNSFAFAFCVPIDGTIDAIGVSVPTIGGNPPAYYCGIVTTDTGTGLPTDTNYGGSAYQLYDFTATGWHWITLSTPATAQAGDMVAARVKPGTSNPDGGNYARIWDFPIFQSNKPCMFYYTGGWTKVYGVGPCAVRYSTGEVVGLPAISFLHGEIKTGSTPDEVGCKFVLPADMKCIGVRIASRYRENNMAFTMKLYDSSNTLLASAGSYDEDVIFDQQDSPYIAEVFWDEVTLTGGDTYRVTFLPDTANGIFIASLDFESQASKESAVPDGTNWTATYRTDAGAWTDDASAIVFIGLMISDITFSAGAASAGAYGFAG